MPIAIAPRLNMIRRVRILTITAALALLAFSGCGGWPPALKYATLQAELNANLAKWTAAGLRSYTYHYSRICFCAPTAGIIRVENGQVVSFQPDHEGDSALTNPADFPTIDELLDDIQQSINDNFASIQVEFDPTLGYPVRVATVTSFWITDAGFTETADSLSGI